MRRFQSKHAGFTLIELAVVTAIIGLLVAGAVASFGAIRTNTKIKETHRAMHSAELLLRAFIARNGRLPCPADPSLNPNVAADAANYAREDRGGVPAVCTGNQVGTTNVYWGTLPARDLGAEPRELSDGWGNQLRYAVVNSAATDQSLTTSPWAQNDANNRLILWDKAQEEAASQQIVSLGVASVLSSGPNGSSGISLEGKTLLAPVATALAELENVDNDINLASATYSEDDATPFDDMVQVYTEEDLVLPLAEMGEVQTKTALTLERMRQLRDVLYGRVLAETVNFAPPADLTGILEVPTVDAWGTAFTYTVGVAVCTGGTDNVFALSSPNVTGVTYSVTTAEAAVIVTNRFVVPPDC